MQLVSVLSISRRMRSCSAAVSTLVILHVAPDGSQAEREPSGLVPLTGRACVMQEEPGGGRGGGRGGGVGSMWSPGESG